MTSAPWRDGHGSQSTERSTRSPAPPATRHGRHSDANRNTVRFYLGAPPALAEPPRYSRWAEDVHAQGALRAGRHPRCAPLGSPHHVAVGDRTRRMNKPERGCDVVRRFFAALATVTEAMRPMLIPARRGGMRHARRRLAVGGRSRRVPHRSAPVRARRLVTVHTLFRSGEPRSLRPMPMAPC
jgi:hypothetical protein